MIKFRKKNLLVITLLSIILILFIIISYCSFGSNIAFAQEQEAISASEASSTTSQQMGISITELNSDMNYLLDVHSDNWFNYNCAVSGNYGFKFYYENTDVRDFLKLGIQLTTSDQLTMVTNIKVLPSISNDARKAIVYNFELIAGQLYNFNFFFENPEQYDADYIDINLILSQWNVIDTVKFNNDFVIKDGEESLHTYHLVAGQPYTINFSSSSDFEYVLFYDETIKDFITKNNVSITDNEHVNTDTKNGDVFIASRNAIGKVGTIYFVDYNTIYSIKFEVVEKPYSLISNFDNSTYLLDLKFLDSYGNLEDDPITNSIRLKFGTNVKEYPIEMSTYIHNFPFTESTTKAYIIVDYSIPWYNDTKYEYTETYEINNRVTTPSLDMSKFNQVSTNKRVILFGEPSSNQTITIAGSVETVILKNITSHNIYLSFQSDKNVTIIMENVQLTADVNRNVIKSVSPNTTLHLINNNSIKGMLTDNSYLVDVKNIKIEGDGYINIAGANGAAGSHGTASSINGGNGQNGTNGLFCTGFESLKGIGIEGGDGGKGGDGYSQTSANGKNGGNGGNGGNAGIGLTIGSTHSEHGNGGMGGNGGNGGDGIVGEDAYVSTYLSWGIYVVDRKLATVGGNGGNGGNTGLNGSGYSSSIMPRAGNGGKGGDGGRGYIGSSIVAVSSTGVASYAVYSEGSANGGNGGAGGHGYIGGTGGNGGAGGNGDHGVDAVWFGTSGSDGGDGSNGGNGGNGGDSWDSERQYGGSGGKGGAGGSGGTKGEGIFTTYDDGVSGTVGQNGTTGAGKVACVAAGTLITLADGSQIPVELLTGNEMLLVWNMLTGKFDVAPILFIDSDPARYYKVINLYFSDGTVVKVIDEHGFWNFDLNQYVFLRDDASQYVGHWFNKQTTDAEGNLIWSKVQLSDVIVQSEFTTTWSPVTYSHLCYYVNGMLSMPGGTTGLINIFEVDPDTMTIDQDKYNADITEYGLFTYEEFAELYPISEAVFEAFNGQYLKVAVGKGILTYEMLEELLKTYADFLT